MATFVALAALIAAVASSQFDPSTCNVQKACFLPTDANCYMGCNGMGFSYAFTDHESMKIELFGNSNSPTGFYFAVGFSDDTLMGNDSVIECSSLSTNPTSLKFSFNQPNFNKTGEPSNVRIKNEASYSNYFQNPVVSYANGQVYCSATVKVSGAADPQIFKFDPNSRYYLMMANGPTSSDGLRHHDHDVTSFAAVNLLDVQQPFDTNGCGVTKGCYIPSADECGGTETDMRVSYFLENSTHLRLEIVGSVPSGTANYVAVGFSTNGMMHNSSVIECSQLGTEPLSVKYSYNDAKPTNMRITGEQAIRASYVQDNNLYQDGQLFCTATVRVDGVAGNNEIFKNDPSQKYYLIIAQGPTNASGLLAHRVHCAPKRAVFLSQLESSFDPSGCGKSKNCFLPTDCYMGCNGMGFSYKIVSATLMQIELFSVATSAGRYVAVGFSTDNQMGDESVIECSSINNETYSLKYSWNVGGDNRYNTRIPEEPSVRTSLITSEKVIFTDGSLYCTAIMDVGGSDASPLIFTYDQNKDYYLLMASGNTNTGGLSKHFDHVVSDQPFDLKSGAEMPAQNPNFNCSECFVTKGCFFPDDPAGCNGYGFAWTYVSETSMVMELMKKSTDGYVAVGFSGDALMGNDTVVECSKMVGKTDFSFKFSFNNPNPMNMRIPGEQQYESSYFTDPTYKVADGLVYCRAVVNVGGVKDNYEIFKYDPSMNYYILLAQGATNETQLMGHSDKAASSMAYNLRTLHGVPPPTEPVVLNTNFNCSQCGTTKGCFFPNDPDHCSGPGFAYVALPNGQIQMELMKDSADGYVAVGFKTSDHMMRDSNVVECSQLTGATLSMKFSYNDNAPSNMRINGEETIRKMYITDTSTSVDNGAMYCRGTVNVSGVSGNSQIFQYDPTQTYYLLLATGQTKQDGLQQHPSGAAKYTNSKVNLSAIMSVGESGGSGKATMRLLHAHAIMMILSWVCFIPTALLFARFLRTSWPLVKPGGLLIWFHVHRTCNLIGIALMIASFICVLCAKDWKWTGPGSKEGKWQQVHTMTGLFALIFAWMQPFVSFMRCHPNTPNRPIFNWIHRSIGIVAYILATTALSIAAYHFLGFWSNPNLQLALVLIPIGLMTLFAAFFPILDKFQEKDHNHATLEMFRQVVILVSVGLMTGLAVALSIMVAS